MSANKTKSVNKLSEETTNGKNKTSYGLSTRTSSTSSSQCASPTKTEAKKIPPIKAPVGLARGPDLKNVKSKIGSLENVKHRPTGGERKVESQKLTWNAKSRIGSLENANHKPLGGEVKVKTQKLEWKATSKVGSLDNVKHTPGGGSIKIFDEKYVPSPSPTTPTPSKSGSMTPTIDSKENGDTLRTLSAAQKSAEKLGQTERPSTTSSMNSTSLESNESVSNKSTPINSAASMRSAI